MCEFAISSNSSVRHSDFSTELTSMHFDGFTLRISRSATGQSCAWPPVNRMAISRPLSVCFSCIVVLRPPRERPIACFCSPPYGWPLLTLFRGNAGTREAFHGYCSSGHRSG